MPPVNRQRQNLSPQQRGIIVGYRLSGQTVVDTARHFGISIGTVSKLMAKYRQYGTFEDRPRSGRPRATSRFEDNEIRRIVTRDRHLTGVYNGSCSFTHNIFSTNLHQI